METIERGKNRYGGQKFNGVENVSNLFLQDRVLPKKYLAGEVVRYNNKEYVAVERGEFPIGHPGVWVAENAVERYKGIEFKIETLSSSNFRSAVNIEGVWDYVATGSREYVTKHAKEDIDLYLEMKASRENTTPEQEADLKEELRLLQLDLNAAKRRGDINMIMDIQDRIEGLSKKNSERENSPGDAVKIEDVKKGDKIVHAGTIFEIKKEKEMNEVLGKMTKSYIIKGTKGRLTRFEGQVVYRDK